MASIALRFPFTRYGAFAVIALAIAVMSPSPPGWSADKKETRQREAQRRTQQAVKQAQDKNLQLEQANSDLANKLKEREQQAEEAQQSLDGFTRKNKRLANDFAKEQSKVSDLEEKLKETDSELQRLRTKLAETSASQLETQHTLKIVTMAKTSLDETLTLCLGKNQRLYQFGRELINHVERPEGFLSVLRAEPFTQMKRVELENIFQDYRDNLDQNHMKPNSLRSSGSQ
ncbi:MAG: hypothetical protein ABJA60_00495 [Nitrosospira sp.]